jgi:hypothetical protein
MLEPMEQKSNTLAEEANLVASFVEVVNPARTKDRTDNELPKCAKPITETDDPHLAWLLIDKLLPNR